MTLEEFNKYCRDHIIRGVNSDQFELRITFIDGESIAITATIDGDFSYTHSAEPLPDNTELLRQIKEDAPKFIDNMIEKYSDNQPNRLQQ